MRIMRSTLNRALACDALRLKLTLSDCLVMGSWITVSAGAGEPQLF